MKSLGRHDMGFDEAKQRIKRATDRSYSVCHGRQRERHAFESIALGLAVQRLMLAELLEHDHRQKTGAGPSPCHGMERRWRLANLFAVAAAELLPHRLDHFPLTRRALQRSGHVLAEFAQPIAAAALASRRRSDHHSFPRKMLGEGLRLGALARKSAHSRRLGDSSFRRKLVFSGSALKLFERQRQLIDQPR